MTLAHFLSNRSPRVLARLVFGIIFGGSLLVMSVLYQQAVAQKAEALRRHGRDLAVAAAALVDVEAHEQLVWADQQDGELYQRILAPLLTFHRQHPSIQYLFTTRWTETEGDLLVLLTSTNAEIKQIEEEKGRQQATPAMLTPIRTITQQDEARSRLSRGQPFIFTAIPYEDEYGAYIEARAPLIDGAGRVVGHLGIDYALDSYNSQINEMRLAGLVSLLLAAVLSAVLARTARIVSERSLQHLREVERQRLAAEQANAAKSELLAVAAHDLKNPLAAINGLAGMLLDLKQAAPDPAAVAEDVEFLTTIHDSSAHMSAIVRDILAGEGLEHDRQSFHPASCDVAALAEDVVRFNRATAQKKGLVLRAAIASPLMAVADREMMHEAFDNYVSNAIKYSPPRRTVTVELRALSEEDAVEFAVQDEGPGLTPEDQAKLFQKFQKLTPRPTGGETSTGLGLSIVKAVATHHGGRVGCDSTPGRGARFWIRWPRAGASPP